MRYICFLTLFTMLLVVPAARAQDNRLPACSAADFAKAESLQEESMRLIIGAAVIESLDELLSIGAAQLAFSDEMWADLPLCDELFRYGFVLEQVTETLLMKLLLQGAGVDSANNPYVELGLESGREMNRLEQGFSAAADDAGGVTSGDLPACSAEERARFAGDFWADIVTLVETLHAVKSFEALLGYIDATLAWRAAVWSDLPPCAEAYDIAIWKYRFTSDIAKLYMLDLFDIRRADNPYGKTYLTGIVQFSDYQQWIDTTGWDYQSLPNCAGAPVDADLLQALRSHRAWSEVPHGAVEELPAFADAHIAWRETLVAALPALPGCREAFEAALLSLQVAGDVAASAALSLSDLELQALGDAYQTRLVNAGDRISALQQALEPTPGDMAAQPASALPTCSKRELNILFDDLQGLGQLQQKAFDIQQADELKAYIEDYFAWRDKLWMALPGCAEAFEIATVMLRMLGDYAANITMLAAGVSDDALPYHEQTERGVDAFNQWHADVWAPIENPVATPGPITTYTVIANGSAPLYECASVDCRIVALVAEGEALRVVDDSGEWFKAYIGADLYGYVRRELTSATGS